MSKNNKLDEMNIRQERSSISHFVERKLPTTEEVNKFEEFLEDEKRDGEIDNSLSEIYQDSDGNKVDVSSLVIKKSHGFVFWFVTFFLVIGIILGTAYGAYYYIYHNESDATAVELKIDSKENVTSGEEIEYVISYRNMTKVPLRDIKIEALLPENFIYIDSVPKMSREYVWEIGSIASIGAGNLRIKGRLIGEKKSVNNLVIKMTYIPENFSSEFKKESSFATVINNIGMEIDKDYFGTVLVGDENDLEFIFNALPDSKITDFYFSIEIPDNIRISKVETAKTNQWIEKSEEKKNTWHFTQALSEKNASDNDQYLKFKYIVDNKVNEKEEILVRAYIPIEKKGEDEKDIQIIDYVFYQEKMELEVMKSDLNLTLIQNGEKNDNNVDFGDTLNYSIVYKNKGENAMSNVIIMMVLDSEFLDWTTLNDKHMGREKGNTITWTKSEIADLATIGENEEGVIDFSIKVASFRESDIGKDFRITAYAQFNVGKLGGNEDEDETTNDEGEEENIETIVSTSTEELNKDNRSNTIISKINSDLSLSEQIRYFNDSNIPVGTGPLPPKVGERSSFKVYWTINNNLHELNDLKVEMPLPAYVSFDGKDRTSVGSVTYNEDEHKIVWNIGLLPISVFRADAEFSIAVTPTEEDRNKIMVLTSGSVVTAVDTDTDETITKTGQARTTKLDDDEIASLSSDGRVE